MCHVSLTGDVGPEVEHDVAWNIICNHLKSEVAAWLAMPRPAQTVEPSAPLSGDVLLSVVELAQWYHSHDCIRVVCTGHSKHTVIRVVCTGHDTSHAVIRVVCTGHDTSHDCMQSFVSCAQATTRVMTAFVLCAQATLCVDTL